MYVQGVSTRKVREVTEALCGTDISSTQVSRLAKELDDDLEKWRTRPLGAVPYLIIDARYEKVRHGGSVVSCAVLVATRVCENGKRSVLGVSCKLSEAVFPSTPWQRCQFHLIRNAFAYVPKLSMRSEVARDLRSILDAPDRAEANRRIEIVAQKYKSSAPELAPWIESNVPESLTVLTLPCDHRRRLRTTNTLEALNKEIKRRTRVATLFPNTESLLRLVSAVLAEVDDEWTRRTHLPRPRPETGVTQ